MSTKTEIQKLVSAALRPAYKNRSINTEQYTDINRDVSRLLYDFAAESSEASDRERWGIIAAAEVDKCIKRLRGVELGLTE